MANTHILMDRGLNLEECKAICTSPEIPLESKLFFRIVYETCFRPFEVQNLLIENWNKSTGEITAQRTKAKYNPKTKEVTMKPRSMIVTPNTNEMLKAYISQRKKGFIFASEKTKGALSLRFFEKQITKYAGLLSIQKVRCEYQGEYKDGKTSRSQKLVTLMALREAGERHHDEAGGDDTLSGKAAGHTMTVKNRYYKKGSYEEAQASFREHHPAFKEGW